MNQAYATRDPKRARRLLEGLARRLEHQRPGAAASLREGLKETLTVMRLGLPENLERVLSSTNLIENLFGRVREIGRRVKRFDLEDLGLQRLAGFADPRWQAIRRSAARSSVRSLSAPTWCRSLSRN